MAFQKPQPQGPPGEYIRVRLPRGKEVLGITEEMLGGSRFRIACVDGKTRICRVPGSLKRNVWVQLGDVVLVEPWEIEPNEKGDVIFRYTGVQANVLRKRGLLK